MLSKIIVLTIEGLDAEPGPVYPRSHLRTNLGRYRRILGRYIYVHYLQSCIWTFMDILVAYLHVPYPLRVLLCRRAGVQTRYGEWGGDLWDLNLFFYHVV